MDTPEVVRAGSEYRLYYFGQRVGDSVEGGAIGLAVSEHGSRFERAASGPVLEPGSPGDWDEWWVESRAVTYDPAKRCWLMLYTGMSREWVASIGLATSSDGVHWVKHSGNPILKPGEPGSWDDGWVAVPAVLRFRSGLWLFYSGVSVEDLLDGAVEQAGVGLAWSTDGLGWLSSKGQPILGTGDSGPVPWAPSVGLGPSGQRLLMWFKHESAIWIATASVPEPARRGVSGRRDVRSR